MSVLKEMNTPVFAAEGVLHIDPKTHILSVGGLVAEPKDWNLGRLKADFDVNTVDCRLTSVSGWSVRADWTGILWSDFLAAAHPLPEARYALFTSAGGYTTAVLLKDLENPRVLLSWAAGGQDLEPEYGGPLRVLIPSLWGYKSCKWLARIDFAGKYVAGYWELRGYSHRGDIEPGETYDVNSRQYRRIGGGEVTEF